MSPSSTRAFCSFSSAGSTFQRRSLHLTKTIVKGTSIAPLRWNLHCIPQKILPQETTTSLTSSALREHSDDTRPAGSTVQHWTLTLKSPPLGKHCYGHSNRSPAFKSPLYPPKILPQETTTSSTSPALRERSNDIRPAGSTVQRSSLYLFTSWKALL